MIACYLIMILAPHFARILDYNFIGGYGFWDKVKFLVSGTRSCPLSACVGTQEVPQVFALANS